MLNLILRFCLVLLCLPVQGYAQWCGFQFDRLGADDGLNSVDIRAIVQDSSGYMYFGGYQQLIRYDGHIFEDFTHDPEDTNSIGPGQISQMITTRDGKICLSMRRDGLNIFDPRFETFTRYAAPVRANSLGPILEDDAGDLWLGADDFTLLKFSKVSDSFTVYRPDDDFNLHLDETAITGILQDANDPDILWVSSFSYKSHSYPGKSAYALFRFNRKSGDFIKIPCAGNLMLKDKNGNLWSGSWSSGLWRYHPKSERCDHLRFDIVLDDDVHPGDGVFTIHPASTGFWIGSRNSVLSVSDHLEHSFILKDQAIGSVNAIYSDQAGNTWIGTSNSLLVLHPGSQHIEFFSLALFGVSERIYPGRLAYHNGENRIYLINRNEKRLYRIPLDRKKKADFLTTPFIPTAVTVDQEGQIFVTGESALYKFTQHQGEFEKILDHFQDGKKLPWLWSMTVHPDGWNIGISSNDFFWFKDVLHSFNHISHPEAKENESVHSRYFLTHDKKALLSGGPRIYEVDLVSGNEREIIAPDDGHLVQDDQGLYWLGTINHIGHYRMVNDSLKLLKYFTAKDGLTNITASQLHVDRNGRIWIFSNSGMSIIDPTTYETRNVGVSEGLPISAIDPIQVIDLPDGRLPTVNDNGIIVFHPDSLWEANSLTNVEVVLKSVRIAGMALTNYKQANFLDHLSLAPHHHTIDIQFQGLAFPADRHISYSYRVDGLHEDWIALGNNNSVTLTKLPPGSYVFRVKAGEPNVPAPVKQFSFTIATPFYLRTWFLFLLGLFLISAITVAYRKRVAQIRKQEEEKMKINRQISELELQALRAQMNPHFMFNSLNSIKNYILKNESAKAAEYLSSFAHLIRLILQHSREKTISLKNELETLLLYIDLEKLRFRDRFEFTCQVDERIDTSHVQLPPMIIQPYIENAIWHGLLHKEDERHLTLRITLDTPNVICEVEDNGIGRAEATAIKSKSATKYKSMGMGITQDRITLMNSMNALGIRVDIIDKTNGSDKSMGTLVKIVIPHARNTD